jgi:FdhD protein
MSALLDRPFTAQRLGLGKPGDLELLRRVPVEAPIAIEYNGIGYAVMMATPADLEAYAVGLTLAEGLVERADEIEDIDVHPIEGGWVVRIILPPARLGRVIERARTRVSESSCGLCGIESIEQVLRPLPPVTARIATSRAAIASALATLPEHQPLSHATGAVHAAAFCTPEGRILAAREDVGIMRSTSWSARLRSTALAPRAASSCYPRGAAMSWSRRRYAPGARCW